VAVELLESFGLKVTAVNNGKDSVQKIIDSEFDLVLMDVNMPVMDGFTATSIIRKHHKPEMLPIIAMTAHAMEGYREKCLAMGMNDYVTKPIDPESLFTTLVKWIQPGEKRNVTSAK